MKVPKFEVFQGNDHSWRWHLKSANGRILCSGEGHTSEQHAWRAIKTMIDTAYKADLLTFERG